MTPFEVWTVTAGPLSAGMLSFSAVSIGAADGRVGVSLWAAFGAAAIAMLPKRGLQQTG